MKTIINKIRNLQTTTGKLPIAILPIALLLFLTAGKTYAQTEIKISGDSLPPTVKEHLHKKYHDYSLTSSVKETDKIGNITYKVQVKWAKNNSETIVYDLIYDTAGKLISKKKDKEVYYTDSPKPKQKQSNDGHNHAH